MGDSCGTSDVDNSTPSFTPTPGTTSTSVPKVGPLWVAGGILNTSCHSLAPATTHATRHGETAGTHSL